MGAPGGYTISGGIFGHNTFGGWSVTSAFLVEFLATLIFTAVILGVTQQRRHPVWLQVSSSASRLPCCIWPSCPSPAILSTLPERSPPIFYVGGQALQQLWLYIVAPSLGGLASGLLFRSGFLQWTNKSRPLA